MSADSPALQRILVPVDGSEPSDRALDFAVYLATLSGAEVDVVTVLDLGQLDFYDGMYMTLDQVEAWQDRLKQHTLDAAMARIPDDGPAATFEVLRGPAARTLLDYAHKRGHGMVVMGRTGKGALREALTGSISSAVVHRAHIPVTLVS